mmetsp:Transcript_78468/g.143601  ORF Transcript_78468/g.143601 Transcript_78468/m.143601 type:complete len:733 (+) Transcript_78468:65-2263(+)
MSDRAFSPKLSFSLRSLVSTPMTPASEYPAEPKIVRLGSRTSDIAVQRYQRFVITESNAFRKFFAGVVALSLLYTATVFPFRLCFLEFRIPHPHPDEEWWLSFELVVDVVFYVDLIINFFLTYRDGNGQEVRNLRKIACQYLTGYFVVNLIACVPPSVVGEIIRLITNSTRTSSTFNKGLRIGRLQRISRIARLTRLARLVKVASFLAKSSAWKRVQSLKGILFGNFVTGLLWIVHLVACGWYLCASLHAHHEETWVGRRCIGNNCDHPLFDASPFEQWCQAMYFVLTVFTTVGFGDMSADLPAEIVYVCFTMLVGAVVHGIIVSEMINVVMRADQAALDLSAQQDLVAGFSRHTEIPKGLANDLHRWVTKSRGSRHGYDRSKMKNLLTSTMPQEIMRQLPEAMFDGKLVLNRFITSVVEDGRKPLRFPVLLALMLNRRNYEAGEIVYNSGEHPFNLFLVYQGTFANIGMPGQDGGVSELSPTMLHSHVVTMSDNAFEATLLRSPTILQNLRRYCNPNQQRSVGKKGVSEKPLHPYQLFGQGNYFGDTELWVKQRRISSVRCESNSGTLLLLHKNDLEALCDDFPSFKLIWRGLARRREKRRQALLQRLTSSTSFKKLAVSVIENYWRERACTRNAALRYSQDEVVASNNAASNKVWLDCLDKRTGKISKHDDQSDVDELRHEMRTSLDRMQQSLDLLVRELQARPSDVPRFSNDLGVARMCHARDFEECSV